MRILSLESLSDQEVSLHPGCLWLLLQLAFTHLQVALTKCVLGESHLAHCCREHSQSWWLGWESHDGVDLYGRPHGTHTRKLTRANSGYDTAFKTNIHQPHFWRGLQSPETHYQLDTKCSTAGIYESILELKSQYPAT